MAFGSKSWEASAGGRLVGLKAAFLMPNKTRRRRG
jgi:hypothetical protein